MIYLFTALYSEAHIFIKKFQLEKNLAGTRFQQFQNETDGILLTVTGVGEIAAATAVSSVCTKHKPKEKDVLLNIGTCARTAGSDGVFLCNKIIEQATGKTFYPDILYRHDFREETIVTGMLPWNSQDVFYHFIKKLQMITAYESRQAEGPVQQEEALIAKLCTDLHCSKVMRDSLRQHIHYLSLAGSDYVSAIQDMYREGLLPCKDKREGKLRFEELKRRLF